MNNEYPQVNYCSLHSESFAKKPTKPNIARISNSIHKYPVSLAIPKIADLVGSNGHSIAPLLTGKRSDKNWKGQRLLLIDFDSNNLNEVRSFLQQYNIPVSFAYYSLSSKPEYIKYRLVFDLGFTVTDKRLMRHILKIFRAIFSGLKSDPASYELSRLWLGGKGLIEDLTQYRTIDLGYLVTLYAQFSQLPRQKTDELIRAVNLALKPLFDQNGSNSEPYYKYNLRGALKTNRFCNKWPYKYLKGCATHNANATSEVNTFQDKLRGILRALLEGNQNSTLPDTTSRSSNKAMRQQSAKQTLPEITTQKSDPIAPLCPAYRDILKGIEHHHHTKYCIATNVVYFTKQRGAFKKALIQLSPDWQRQYNTILRSKLLPYNCSETCPYKCRKNIYHTVKSKVIEHPDDTIYQDIELAQKQIDDTIRHIISNPDGKIHIIDCQPGIGKTEMILKYDVPKFFPTHKLKDEVAARISKAYPDKYYRVARQPNLPKDLSRYVSQQYNIGNWTYASYLVKLNDLEYKSERKRPIKGHYLGTHQQLLLQPSIIDDVIICDEDIDGIVQIDKHRLSDIGSFMDFVKNKDERRYRHCERLLSQGQTKRAITETSTFWEWYRDFCDKYHPKSNISSLLKSTVYYSDSTNPEYGYTGHIRRLPSSKTIIILSATPATYIYKALYPDRVVHHQFAPVKYQGRLTQYAEKSFSKTQLVKTEETLHYEDLKKHCQDEGIEVVTFMNLKSKLTDNLNNPHLGNSRGYDSLKGKDLLLFGTLRVSEQTVKITAKLTHTDFEDNAKRKNMRVTRNNKTMTFNTFEDKSLQEIDLFYTEREMEQAVGRARLIRQDCDVLAVTNYPLAQSEIIY